MGGFYGSIQIRSDDRSAAKAVVEEVANELQFRCLLGPSLSGWIGVYPAGNGQDERLGAAIAGRIGGIVWHVLVHDDDVLTYSLWEDGKLADSFWSLPGYFSEDQRVEQEKLTGDPEVLSRLVGGKVEDLRELLSRESGYTFEVERLEKLSRAVGVRNLVTAYEYIKSGETDGVVGWRKFTELPAAARSQARQAAQAKKQAIAQLKKRGLLRLHEVDNGEYVTLSAACAAPDGFCIFRNAPHEAKISVAHYPSSGALARELPWGLAEPVFNVAADATGARVALALGTRVEVREVPSGELILAVPEGEHTYDVRLSADGRVMASIGRHGLKLLEVSGGRQILTGAMKDQDRLALHPRAEAVAVAFQKIAFRLVSDDTWRYRSLVAAALPSAHEPLPGASFSALGEDEVEAAFPEFRRDLEARMRTLVPEPRLSQELASLERQTPQLKLALEQLIRAQKEARGEAVFEQAAVLGFSRDAKWLWCATTRGLWVFAWDDLLASGAESRAVWWHPTAGAADWSAPVDRVTAIVEEPAGEAIVFSMLGGRLCRMDLADGRAKELIALVEGQPIGLAFSGDGGSLGVLARSDYSEPKQRMFWQIWDYANLQQAVQST
jgi:hypothetical protein